MYASVKRICIHCEKEYFGNPKTKYCGYNCSHAARKRRVSLVCQECGKEFERQSWDSNAKFCSFECKVKNQSSELIETTCKTCGILFSRKIHLLSKNISENNFCSKQCADKFNSGSNHYEWNNELFKNYKPNISKNKVKSQNIRSITRRARKLNITTEELLKIEQEEQFKINQGLRFCNICKEWKLPNKTNPYCEECSIERNKKNYNPEESRTKSLKLKYGLTINDYDKLLLEQNNKCYICHIHVSKLDRSLAVDHCHKTGKVRGLLCGNCNRFLGQIDDNVDTAKRLVEYLLKSSDI